MENKISISMGGYSLATALTVLFVALKLLGKISWSWVWVLSPLWISVVLSFCLFMLCLLIAIIIHLRE